MTNDQQDELAPDSPEGEEAVVASEGGDENSPADEAVGENATEPVATPEEPVASESPEPEQVESPAETEPVDSPEETVEPVASAEPTDAVEPAASQASEEPAPAPKKSKRKSSPEPLELIEEPDEVEDDIEMDWYILKVAVNREGTVRDNLERRVKVAGLERYFGDIVVPVEETTEFNKDGKKRTVRKKLFPGYIVIRMAINDDSWFLVRETPGIGDFTGAAGKPAPLPPEEIQRILKTGEGDDTDGKPVTSIKYKVGDKVRVKDGYFQNFEGDIETVDEANGRVTVLLEVFGRKTPVELGHWEVESVD